MKRDYVRAGLLGITILMLIGCSDPAENGEPRIDLEGTQRDFDRSQERLRDALTEDRRGVFDEAMRILYYRALELRESGVLPAAEVEALLQQQIHDQTAAEIVGEALRTYREFCIDNAIPESDCDSSIESAGLDAWQ